MRKQLIRTSTNKDLSIILNISSKYDDKQCFYIVSSGNIKINKNGDVSSRNELYSSKCLQDCLNYFENEGTK